MGDSPAKIKEDPRQNELKKINDQIADYDKKIKAYADNTIIYSDETKQKWKDERKRLYKNRMNIERDIKERANPNSARQSEL